MDKNERQNAKNFFLTQEVGCCVENDENGREVRKTSRNEYALYLDEKRVKKVKNLEHALDFLLGK